MDKKTLPRRFFDNEPVYQAYQEYIGKWKDLQDPIKGSDMLQRHGEALKEEIRTRKNEHKILSDKLKDSKDAAERKVLSVALAHASRDISIMTRAEDDIEHNRDYILSRLAEESVRVLAKLDQGENAIFDAAGNIKSERIKNIYSKSRSETWERYAQFDAIYELGIEFAIEEQDAGDRAYLLATIPRELRDAKWKFMLALADAAYSIDIGHLGGESIGPRHLTLLSHMLASLSDRERGADNDHMPYTHKYRHNPALHSLHALGLADKILHAVRRQIDHDPKFHQNKEDYINRLNAMRSLIFLNELLHDGGEERGELSQGIHLADIKDETLKKAMKKVRGEIEDKVFTLNLNKARIHLEPISDQEWKHIHDLYHNAYALSEKKDTFLGRVCSVIERMQSQQDYLRFQNQQGAKALIKSSDVNKEFSCNYVPTVFYDSTRWNGTSKGPQALTKLADKGKDKIDITLQRMISEELEKELAHLMEWNIKSYYGEASPEMKQCLDLAANRARSSHAAA